MKLFPYKRQPEGLAFCKNFMVMIEEDEGLPERIVVSDEAKFHLSVKVYRQNVRLRCDSDRT